MEDIKITSETEEQQRANDALIIPEPGMSRTLHQKGRVNFKDGTGEDVILTFVRTRNSSGGVDVLAKVPALNTGKVQVHEPS